MANDNFTIIINDIINNSQKDQAAEDSGYDRGVEKKRKAFEKELSEIRGLSEDEIEKRRAQFEDQLARDKAAMDKEAEKEKHKDLLEMAKQRVEEATNLEEKKQAEADVKRIERLQAATDNMVGAITSTMTNLFSQIKNSGKEYADYVERIEVGLIGSTKNYDNVTQKLDKVFSMSAFFSYKDVLEKTAQMVEKGIAYNVELRSALDVMSDKIASTFDAFDSNLLRLIRIQQADSTQARLGMESLLTYYLNENFQNTEYLHGLSDQVSSAIMEAMATYSGENRVSQAAEFEYSVQKWLGSFSSAGVSDSTVTALAQAIGYLGSGDVSALTSNSALQQLMAIAISRSGSQRSYGDMLLNGISGQDVSDIMTGFYSLVQEISSQDNLVALNQYAKIFNLTVSDITSVLNLNADSISAISQNMKSYSQMVEQVNNELGYKKLFSRSSFSEQYENFKNNIFTSIGLDMANNLGANLAYELVEQAAAAVDMIELGLEVDPFGVGASTKIKAGDILKGTTALATYLGAYAKNIGALTSIGSPNLGALGGESSRTIEIIGGTGTNDISSGSNKNVVAFTGNTENSAVYNIVNSASKDSTSEILKTDIDEEKEKMDKTMSTMKDIGDNVAFIVQLLNIDGIRIRALPRDFRRDVEAEYDPENKPMVSKQSVNGSGGNALTSGGY